MKKFVSILFVAVLMFTLSACSTAPASLAVQLPGELVTLIGFAVMVGVTAAFKWLGGKLGGVDLAGQAAVIASAFASLLVIAINYGLQLVPAAYDNLLSSLFAFLIVFFGGAGFYSLVLRKKSKAKK